MSRILARVVPLCSAAALSLCGCSAPQGKDGGSPDAGTAAEYRSAFGVFASFTNEYAPFGQRAGLDPAGYREWAGGRMNELGARWTRSNLQLAWDFVEPSKGGAFDWNASFGGEEVFAAAARHGVHYLGVFHAGSGPGSAAQPGKIPMRNPLDDLPAWQRFAQAAAERYDGDGVDDAPGGIVIRDWQIGNEVQEWTTASGRTDADYLRWFVAAAEAIHRADPGARLVLIAPTDAKQLDPFLNTVISNLAAQKVRFDAIDLHHWGAADAVSSRMIAVPQYQAAFAAAGVRDVEIWSMEHGTYLGTPVEGDSQCAPACPADKACTPMGCLPRCSSSASCTAARPICDTTTGRCQVRDQSAREQARSVVYRYSINRALGVRLILWNNLVGWRCFGVCGSQFDRMGLVADGWGPGETEADVGKRRLAFHAYRLLAARTDEPIAEQLGEVSVGDAAVHVFGYRNRVSGKTGLVAWADAARQVSLSWTGPNAWVSGFITDEAGIPLRSESIVASGGEITVALDADPVWIADQAN